LLFFNFGILIFEIITANDSFCYSEDIKIHFYQQVTFKSLTAKAYEIIAIGEYSSILKKFIKKENKNIEDKKTSIENLGLFANEKYEIFENNEVFYLKGENIIDVNSGLKNYKKDETAFVLDFNSKYTGYSEFHKERISLRNHLIAECLEDSNCQTVLVMEEDKESELVKIKYNFTNKKFFIE
jgi:hypothetical protein